MGEVAVMQFECNDMKLMTEKDVYNLPSNEHVHEEKSSQSSDHKKIDDLREREDIWNMDVNIIGEGVVLGPLVAIRYLIAAIVTMKQKIASALIRSTDTTFPAIESNRLQFRVLIAS